MTENLTKIWNVIEGIWESIVGFFSGIANALIENPGIAIALGIGILLAIIFKK